MQAAGGARSMKHTRVDRAELIQLQQEDCSIKKMGEATVQVGYMSSFKKRDSVQSVPRHNPRRNYRMVSCTSKSLRKYVMLVAFNIITGSHLGIKKTREKIMSNFYWPGIDGDVTRYCHSCDVCQKTVREPF